ncbi:response regulator transcription factor [Paenibacillus sp. JJ-223]|uniref:response regulator transcription factor n=1 Tax=Paenibacillus sp. JJ-223 TaxID=2905647 RepID=UPI001F1EFEC0|nr:response regulator transcription factor [Paenibacillus sp. JJ-223]
MNTYKIMIVDDHYVVREGLKLILETGEQFQVIAEAENGKQAVQMLEKQLPDIILMDLNMPVMGGLEAMQILKDRNCEVPIIILTTYNEDELMIKGLALGAKGYLLKDTSRESLFRSIESAVRGETLLSSDMLEKVIQAKMQPKSESTTVSSKLALTDKELMILQFVSKGYKSKEIAAAMDVSERTIKAHLTSVYNKLGVDSRSQAVAIAMERGILKS